MTTNRDRMQTLLGGGIPDVPPTWEIAFYIHDEYFGGWPSPDPAHMSEHENSGQWSTAFQILERCVEEFGYGAIRGGYDHEECAFIKKRIGDRALVVGYEGGGVFWMPNGEDMMDFAVGLYEKPEEIQDEARRKCDMAKESFRRLVDAGADLLLGTWDFGYNNAPFVSPDKFAEIVTPYMAELADCAHGLGRKLIVHSDGCLNHILDQIHGTGIDGYQSVDPQGHMDIKAVRERYPDWILMGNVACNMLQDTDETKIRESVRYCMKHGGIGKPYIFSTSNCVYKGMPPESYRIMLDEYRTLCDAAQAKVAPTA